MTKRMVRRIQVDETFERRVDMLLKNAETVIAIWDAGDQVMRKSLYFTMIELAHNMRAMALEKGGYGKTKGLAHDVQQAAILFTTGDEAALKKRCSALTVKGKQCANFPWLGEEHCWRHGSNAEKRRYNATHKAWEEHFTALHREIGVLKLTTELWARVNETKEYE
jgi:hypothetical protein